MSSITLPIGIAVLHIQARRSLPLQFYSYSINGLTKIVLSSGDISWVSYIVFTLIVVIFFVLVRYVHCKTNKSVILIWLIWLITMPNISYSHVKAKFFDTEQNYYIVKNKAIYFIEQTAKYLKSSNKQVKEDYSIDYLIQLSKDYSSLYPDNEYLLPTYPLLRKRDDKDVLGRYFQLNDSLPNIVFIMMESMGRNICGPGARFGSFTPFLDSLIEHSLYWENFLSNADRTFGAIPNILGSLPFGDKSFHDHKEKSLPLHNTIITDLKKNGYHSSFYYGGWTHFNNMDDILNASKIDFILDKFDSTATKIKSDSKGFSWGYDDKSLYKQYIKTINSDSVTNLKRLDIILTLSLHAPFMPPNENYYLSQFNEIKDGMPKNKRALVEPYSKPLTTALYADDAIRFMFKEYKKRKDFNNTIFIVTGDHNLHAMPDDNEIRQFHIPLIIYSPMLKQKNKFESLSGHQDIYPGIIAMLNHKYKLVLPKTTHTISNGIYASEEFKQNKIIPFFLGRNLRTSILDNGYFYSNDKCYLLKKGMNLETVTNDSICHLLKRKLRIIKEMNKYVYNEDKIVPYKR